MSEIMNKAGRGKALRKLPEFYKTKFRRNISSQVSEGNLQLLSTHQVFLETTVNYMPRVQRDSSSSRRGHFPSWQNPTPPACPEQEQTVPQMAKICLKNI